MKRKKKKTTATQTASTLKETCPKCHTDVFTIADTGDQQRYCGNRRCKHVWLPQTKDQIKLNAYRQKFETLTRHMDYCLAKINEHKADHPILAALRSELNMMKDLNALPLQHKMQPAPQSQSQQNLLDTDSKSS